MRTSTAGATSTATRQAGATPAAESARPKLWAKAAPATMPSTVSTGVGIPPSPAIINCAAGQPPARIGGKANHGQAHGSSRDGRCGH